MYAGIETLADTGDAVQWGGAHLCEGPDGPSFPTPDGKAHFSPVRPPAGPDPDAGRFRLATRRGKQFNTMVFKTSDPLTGAQRDSLLMAPEDAARLDLDAGALVLVRSGHGEVRARVHLAGLRPGNVQMHFPEANALVPAGPRDKESGVPDFNAIVEVVPLETR